MNSTFNCILTKSCPDYFISEGKIHKILILFLILSNIDVVILCMDYQQQQIEILRDKIQ